MGDATPADVLVSSRLVFASASTSAGVASPPHLLSSSLQPTRVRADAATRTRAATRVICTAMRSASHNPPNPSLDGAGDRGDGLGPRRARPVALADGLGQLDRGPLEAAARAGPSPAQANTKVSSPLRKR